jgi:hypothetical protein
MRFSIVEITLKYLQLSHATYLISLSVVVLLVLCIASQALQESRCTNWFALYIGLATKHNRAGADGRIDVFCTRKSISKVEWNNNLSGVAYELSLWTALMQYLEQTLDCAQWFSCSFCNSLVPQGHFPVYLNLAHSHFRCKYPYCGELSQGWSWVFCGMK